MPKTALAAALAIALCFGPGAKAESFMLKVSSAVIAPDPTTGSPVLTIQFRDDSVDQFSTFTAKHVGDMVTLSVDGINILQARLVEPIRMNTIAVSGPDVSTIPFTTMNNMNNGDTPVEADTSP